VSRAHAVVDPVFFADPEEFRRWLEEHHATVTVLWVGFHRRATGRPSLTWTESVDEALSFGWIDGVRKQLDATRYAIRFTPRRADSTWSAVNTQRMAELIAAGRVAPAGLAAFERRRAVARGLSSREERERAAFPPELERRFRAVPGAWRWFQAQPPWYRRATTHWVASARRAETRRKRLETLLACSAAGEPIPALARAGKTPAAPR
jgi:uncharacterized protein YdeI (YjbR/CyaY-like superfamily)